MRRHIFPFLGTTTATLAEVGGKGLSLIRMTQAGLAVPPGFVLGVGFFHSWLEALRQTDHWHRFTSAGDDDARKRACDALKARAHEVCSFDGDQREAVDEALRALAPGALFAVRSSSPEEDLEGASFAGGYETVLGVTRATLEGAVLRAFASCLDARVAVYKQQNGFDWRHPRIAIVVQRQIASDVAGVGFSVNPLTNAYDELVFNANFGLGETVVAGLATPDLFVVDRAQRALASKTIGKKQTSLWLKPNGGTEERADPRALAGEPALSEAQVLALAAQLVRVEEVYGRPMDIEWAFESDALYLLQARPITTHFALPPSMVTPPGARKRLYWDVTISVQGFFQAISPLGEQCFRALLAAASSLVFGKDLTASIDTTVPFVAGGRLWINLSNTLTLSSLAAHESLMQLMDPVCAQALGSVDEQSYRGEHSIKQIPWSLIWSAPEKAAQILEARLAPEHAKKSVERAREQHWHDLRAMTTERDTDLRAFASQALQAAAHTVFAEILPYFAVSKLAMSRLRDVLVDLTPEQQLDIAKLDQSLPGNVTVEMGLALAELAAALPADTGLEALEAGLAARTLPPAFLAGWEAFIAGYGHRGPREIDIAAPRFREEPRMLLTQLASLTSSGADSALTPRALYERSQRERREAFARLAEAARAHGFIAHQRFRSLAKVVECLGGLRETPKFHIVLAFDAIRTRALGVGESLRAAGRIDASEDVFDLSWDDLDLARREPTSDVRTLVAKNRAERARYDRSKEKPRLIDSRGRIIRPRPAPLKPGELSGFAVSTGTARGRVKVLHTPDEKPFHQGEVLVARATDPGWTPLFVNAAAVVLEVGGMMQHGALVAREYGKPCVVGIDDATGRLHDGDLIEVDGTAGIVRVVEKAESEPVSPSPAAS